MPQQRLWEAVQELAVSPESIQERLYSAGVALSPLMPGDFQEADRPEFVGIMNALTARDAIGEEGTLKATTVAMSDEDAVEIARRIVALDAAYRPLS